MCRASGPEPRDGACELFDAQRLAVDGVIQRQDGVQHVVARRLRDYGDLLPALHAPTRDFR